MPAVDAQRMSIWRGFSRETEVAVEVEDLGWRHGTNLDVTRFTGKRTAQLVA